MGRITLILSILLAAAVSAEPPVGKQGDTDKDIWIKAKCALCHGEDGASDTPTGKKTKAPDLRDESIQEMSDEKLAACIKKGHKGMPSFEMRLTDEEREKLLRYVRQLKKNDSN